MKKLGLLLLCFVFFLSGCSLTQNEKADRKESYETDGKKPKNLDETLLELGFRVENIDKNFGKRDQWDIVHVNQDEQTAWKGVKLIGGTFRGAGEFMYRTYLYGDDPDMLFYGNGEDFEESIFGVGIKEGFLLQVDDYANVKEWKDRAETIKKIMDIYDFTTDFIEFDKAHDFFSMKTMNVFNHAIMKKEKKGLDLYEWAFIEDPYQDPTLFQIEADALRYPMNSKKDIISLGDGKDEENPVRMIKHGDRLEFFNGEELPTYKDSPKINIKTDGSKKEAIENKKKIQRLLYDIYQVLQGKPTAYYENYAYHLVEDYVQNKRNFETNFYSSKGKVALEANKIDEAEASFENALKIRENHIPALLGKAKIYLMQIQTDKAMDIYRRVLKDQLDEKTAKELNIKSLSKFFIKNPNDYILIDIMQTFYELEKDKEMVEFFEENAKQKTHTAVSFYYAQSLFRLGKCEEALQYLAKAKSEVPNSIPNEINKKYALKAIEKIEEDWKNKGCGKKESDADFSEWYITFEIDPKTKKAKLGIPEGGHVLDVKKGNTIKMVEKNKDPKHITKVVFTGPALDVINPKGESQSEIEKDGEFTALAKDKGTGLISILPDGDWEKEHKIVVFIR